MEGGRSPSRGEFASLDLLKHETKPFTMLFWCARVHFEPQSGKHLEAFGRARGRGEPQRATHKPRMKRVTQQQAKRRGQSDDKCKGEDVGVEFPRSCAWPVIGWRVGPELSASCLRAVFELSSSWSTLWAGTEGAGSCHADRRW